MAPAGDWTMLNAAINAGADAVYFGIDKLNMRAKANNFSVEELKDVVSLCKKKSVKSYLTINSIIYEEELDEAEEIIRHAKENDVDRIICWDMAAVDISKKLKMPFCISTQASVSNSSSANFYKSLGAVRVVLARECSLKDIKKIKQTTELEVEAFIHGAMCIAVSGRCFMSHHLFGKSANRGECIQPCRREYKVYDEAINKSMIVGEDYIMSPNDLCSIEFIDKLIEAGIDSFKIEGRKRSPEYIATTVSVYRNAIDDYFNGILTTEKKREYLSKLSSVFNRGFSSGFYFGVPGSEEYANIYGSKATKRKEYIGKVINYYKKNKVAFVSIETGTLHQHDEILIIGPTTGVVELEPDQIVNENVSVASATRGERVTFPCAQLVRPQDAVYAIRQVVADE